MRNPFRKKVTLYAEGEFQGSTAREKKQQVEDAIKRHGGEIISCEIWFECKSCFFKLQLKEENMEDFSFCPRCGELDRGGTMK